MNNKHYLIKFLLFSVLFFGYTFYIISININEIQSGYKSTLCLPYVFLTCFFLFIYDPLIKKRTPFLVLFSSVIFIRYVVLSIATVNNKGYIGISGVLPESSTLNESMLLMSWELLISSIFISYWSKKYIPNYTKKEILYSDANIFVYILFILLSLMLLILIPESRQGLSFFSEINRAMNDEIGSLLVLGIRELFLNAKYFLLFTCIIILKRMLGQNKFKKSLFSYSIIGLMSIVVIGLRIGTNRKKMIGDAVPVALLLWKTFPYFKQITTILISSVGIFLVVITTIYREMTSSASSFFSEYFDIEFLQPYFLGQYNISIAIEAKKQYFDLINYETYILGFLRPLFGIGSFIKDYKFNSVSSLFDMRISLGLFGGRGDQIIPSIGEGYMLYGFFLSPIIILIIFFIGIKMDSIYSKTNSMEISFLVSLIAFYTAQGMILNSTIILNTLSFKLVIFLPVVFLAYKLRKKNKIKYKSIGGKV